eukprot:gene10767-biopygen18334
MSRFIFRHLVKYVYRKDSFPQRPAQGRVGGRAAPRPGPPRDAGRGPWRLVLLRKSVRLKNLFCGETQQDSWSVQREAQNPRTGLEHEGTGPVSWEHGIGYRARYWATNQQQQPPLINNNLQDTTNQQQHPPLINNNLQNTVPVINNNIHHQSTTNSRIQGQCSPTTSTRIRSVIQKAGCVCRKKMDLLCFFLLLGRFRAKHGGGAGPVLGAAPGAAGGRYRGRVAAGRRHWGGTGPYWAGFALPGLGDAQCGATDQQQTSGYSARINTNLQDTWPVINIPRPSRSCMFQSRYFTFQPRSSTSVHVPTPVLGFWASRWAYHEPRWAYRDSPLGDFVSLGFKTLRDFKVHAATASTPKGSFLLESAPGCRSFPRLWRILVPAGSPSQALPWIRPKLPLRDGQSMCVRLREDGMDAGP